MARGTRTEGLAAREAPLPMPFALGAAACGVLVSLAAATVAVVLHEKLTLLNPSLKPSATELVAVLTTLPLAALVLWWRARGPRARAGAIMSLVALGWLPMFYLGIAMCRMPVVDTSDSGAPRVLWESSAVSFALLVFVPQFLGGALLATVARFPRAAPLLRGASLLSLVVVGAASVVASFRARRPDPNAYVASLPVVRELVPGQSFTTEGGTSIAYVAKTDPARAGDHDRTVSCTLAGVTGAAVRQAADCSAVTVRHEDDVWVVDPLPGRHGDGAFSARDAFTTPDRRSHALYVSDIAAHVAPPLAWTLGALLGLGLGCAFCLAAWRVERRLARLTRNGALEGRLSDDGWATFASRPPLLLVPETAVAEAGPVLVQVSENAVNAYREGPGVVKSWERGTLKEVRETLAGRATSLYAIGMTSALLCAGPLLVSALGAWR